MSKKDFFGLIFIIIIPLIIFFIPLIVSLFTGQWWYLFLFFVTWLPALIIAAFSASVYERS
jgi:hypothetical protein